MPLESPTTKRREGTTVKIVTLVKQVPDTYEKRQLSPETGILERGRSDQTLDEITERAIEASLAYGDAHAGTDVVLLSMGPATAKESLRRGLAMGASAAVHIEDDALAGADAVVTAAVLAAALRRMTFDIVIAGNRSTDGGGGIVPVMVAEHLGLPHLSCLDDITIEPDNVRGQRASESAIQTVSASLPAVVSITENFPEARLPGFRGIMGAKRKPFTTWSLEDLGVASELMRLPKSRVLSVATKQARTAGTIITDGDTAATELAQFLADHRLV
jgi:electron transfer flavoprotein beta subunit